MTSPTLHRCCACGELVRLVPDLQDLHETTGTCAACGRETLFSQEGRHLLGWTVYRRPADYPEGFLARMFVGIHPTTRTLKAESLEALRRQLPPGLFPIPHSPFDDPVIAEVWI